jgi:alanyl-tRNA synthetase
MGLERVVAVTEGVKSNYDSSLFMPIIKKIEALIKREYIYKDGASYRVIADHIRTVLFLLAQGVNFSNEGRGYVLRRILRRGVRHGYLLGFEAPFMHNIVDTVVDIMGSNYPYLVEKAEIVKEQIFLEEERFYKTIADGIELFNKELSTTKDIFSGEVAFKLYDTFGFPLDLTEDMLREKNLTLDTAKFEALMREQRERSKASWKGSGDDASSGDFKTLLEKFGVNEFVGYENLKYSSKVLALLGENFEIVDSISAKHKGWVLLDKTPFYAMGGGQAGDIGTLGESAKVVDTRNYHGLNLSHIEVEKSINTNDIIEAKVDVSRFESAKHHSATHVLHAVLFEILGDHISQAGSLVEHNRLRFDFSHPKALTHSEIAQIEEDVNYHILHATQNDTKVMSIDEAKKMGAKAQFGEKYGESVRVVKFGSVSTEFCGGVHVDNLSSIGTFVITKESGVSAGVRRIEAVCGNAAYNYLKAQRHTLDVACEAVKNRDLLHGIERLKSQISELKSEIKDLSSSAKEVVDGEMINGVKVIIAELSSGDVKERIDELKNENDSIAVMLFQVKDEKVTIAAGVKNSSIKAGDWIKEIAPILGGGGGGRPDFAQAGGKDVTKLPQAKEASLTFVKGLL